MIRTNTQRTLTPIVLAMLAGTAMGGPEGEDVAAGHAQFVRNGQLTEITAADNTIINYQSFNIGANETVRFIQPGAEARVLNRVLGQDPSRIDGSLIANGQVYLVNEAGVYFGDRAIVSVGGIHAAAGTMTDADFLGNVDRFSNLSGAVENAGRIEAGEVHFAGRRVTNLGAIVAPDGLVTMSAGDEVLIGEFGGHLFVSASGSNAGEVRQEGQIQAAGGRVMVGAGDMFSIAIGPGSRTTAKTMDVRGGEGSVARVEGVIDASDRAAGATGGDVTITAGDGVAVLGASIDASGDAGGGRIRIGGGFQGQDSSVEHAQRVNVSQESLLSADAITSGDGGRVIVWSDGATLFTGGASAQGGRESGDGGLVEVSSRGWLGFFGDANTRAENGRNGLLLLDPDNIQIVSGEAGSRPDDSLLDDNQLPASDAMGMDVVISDGTIENLDDTDILIAATNNIAITNLGDGALSLPVTAGNTVTFMAGGTLAGQGSVRLTTEGGNLVIDADGGIQVPSFDTAGGDLTLDSGGDIMITQSIMNVGLLTLNAGGSDRRVVLSEGATFDMLSLDADELSLGGSLFSSSAIDFTGLDLLESPDPQRNVAIAAVDGVDTFDITIDPSTEITGPGGMRFVARNLTLFGTSGLSRLEVTATETLTLSGNIRTDNTEDGLGGDIDFSDVETVVIAGDVLIDTQIPSSDERAGDILLGGTTVRGDSDNTHSLTLDANGEGGNQFDGAIVLGDVGGDGGDLADLTIFGGDLRLTGSIFQPGGIDFSRVRDIEIAGDVLLDTRGGNLDVGENGLDGTGTLVIDLDTNSGDSGAFITDGGVGRTTPLESFTIFATTIQMPDVHTSGDQLYRGERTLLTEDLRSDGGTITFDARANVLEDVQLRSIGGEVRFMELVNGSAELETLTETGATVFEKSVFLPALSARGDVRFDGSAQNIVITNDLVLGEDVTRDRIDMASGTKLIRSEMGDVIFNGPVNGPANLTVSLGTGGTGDDIPVIRFGSNVGAAQSLTSLTLGDGRSDTPRVASVVAANFDDDGEPVTGQLFTFRTTGDFTMAANEKLTALGSLLIESVNGTATLGDLTAPGEIRVNAQRIEVRTRDAGEVFAVDASQDPEELLPADGRTDTGVDIVSGDAVILNAPTIVAIGGGANPVIAEPEGEAKISGFQTRANQGLSIEELYFNRREGTGGGAMRDETTVLDARGLGSVTVLLAQAIPAEDRQNQEVLVAAQELGAPNPRTSGLAGDESGDVLIRNTSAQERRFAREGVIWHIDLAESPKPGSGDFRVASARLDQGAIREFRQAWGELAQALGVEPGERGIMLSRVRSLLNVAVQQYKQSSGEQFVDAEHFALFADLRTANQDAWVALGLMSEIIVSAEELGMTPNETTRFKRGVLEAIRPQGLDIVDLERLIDYAGQEDAADADEVIEAPEGQR